MHVKSTSTFLVIKEYGNWNETIFDFRKPFNVRKNKWFRKNIYKKKHILYKCTYNKYGVYDDLLKWINIAFLLKDNTRIVVKKYV